MPKPPQNWFFNCQHFRQQAPNHTLHQRFFPLIPWSPPSCSALGIIFKQVPFLLNFFFSNLLCFSGPLHSSVIVLSKSDPLKEWSFQVPSQGYALEVPIPSVCPLSHVFLCQVDASRYSDTGIMATGLTLSPDSTTYNCQISKWLIGSLTPTWTVSNISCLPSIVKVSLPSLSWYLGIGVYPLVLVQPSSRFVLFFLFSLRDDSNLSQGITNRWLDCRSNIHSNQIPKQPSSYQHHHSNLQSRKL